MILSWIIGLFIFRFFIKKNLLAQFASCYEYASTQTYWCRSIFAEVMIEDRKIERWKDRGTRFENTRFEFWEKSATSSWVSDGWNRWLCSFLMWSNFQRTWLMNLVTNATICFQMLSRYSLKKRLKKLRYCCVLSGINERVLYVYWSCRAWLVLRLFRFRGENPVH